MVFSTVGLAELQLKGLLRWLHPPVPADIRAAVAAAQYHSIDRQVPLLHTVAILNLIVVMAISRSSGYPPAKYAWMFGLVLFSAYRIFRWRHRSEAAPNQEALERMLRAGTSIAMLMMVVFSGWGTYGIMSDLYGNTLIVPMSMTVGALCVTHSLVSIRLAGVWGTAIALLPMALALMATGTFNFQMLGLILMLVALMKMRISAQQYEQLVTSISLARQNEILANTDALTGLANRRAMMAALEDAESALHIGAKPFGIALLDLDGFKLVNDRHGHHIGDLLLKAVAERLQMHSQLGDLHGRLGGDEFIVLFRNITDYEDVEARTTSLLAALCRPLRLDDKNLPVAASLGYALAPRDGHTTDSLLIAADRALYRAKKSVAPAKQTIRTSLRA